MTNFLKMWTACFLVMALAGCKTTPTKPTYFVEVDSIAAEDPDPIDRERISYALIPGNEGTSPNDLQYLEFAKYVERALEEKGFYQGYIVDQVIGFSYGVSGPIQRVNSYGYVVNVYERYVTIAAFQPKSGKDDEVKILWKTSITSTGSSGDLRRVFPVLIAAAMPFISENTGQRIAGKINEDADAVHFIMGHQDDSKEP